MIRVLVVDDSPTMRQVIRAVLESDSELKVVGEAYNGINAVALCEKLQPDIITMDIRMPEMNGFEAIRTIMAESPRPIVVLTSTRSDIELGTSFNAIDAGALMVCGKPRGLPGEDPAADRLIQQIKIMAEVKVVRRRWHLTEKKTQSSLEKTVEANSIATRPLTPRLIAIGTSTGGPPALQMILKEFTASLPVPVVIVQHISSGFVEGLAHWLDGTTPLRVKVAEICEVLEAGTVYLAPEDQHLMVTKHGRVRLRASPEVDGHRPSATVLFESVAESYGPNAVGILLTGMGRDGAQGLKTLREKGGHTIAQDEASSVIFGMPKEAIALGAAEKVLSLEQITSRLKWLLRVKEAT